MHEGTLLEVGAPRNLYLHPAHRVTAAFLGAANFIAASVERHREPAGEAVAVTTSLGIFVAQGKHRVATEFAGGTVFSSGICRYHR